MAHKVVKASLSLLLTLAFSAAYGFPIDASDERFDGVEDNVIAGDFLDNLDANGSTITVLPVTPPGVGLLNVLPGSGNFIYTPEPEFSGVVTFNYTVETTDGICGGPLPLPGCSDGGTVTLFVEPQADFPGDFAANDVSGSEDTTLALDITATFVDTSETTNIVLTGVPPTATLSAGALQGDGSYILTPAQLPGLSLTTEPNFNGTLNLDIDIEVVDSVADPDGITITDSDDGNIGFNATFTPVDDDPVLVGAVPNLVIDEDDTGGVNLAGLVNDPDGDTLFYAIDSISGGAIDPATTDMTGSNLTVGLLADQVDPGTVTVEVSDGAGVPVSLAINVSVTPLNDPPFVVTAAVPTVDVLEDADAVTIDVAPAFDDVDIATSSDVLDFSIPVVADALFDDVSLAGSSLTIDFAANANGVTSFPVTASDGDVSVSFNLNVTVDPVPDEPRLIAPVPSLTIPEDGSDSVNIAALVDDFDIATNADSLSITVDGISSAALVPGDVSLSAGVLTITPSANLFDPSGTVTIRVDDDDSNVDVDSPVSLTFNVPVAVTSVNDVPVLVGTLPDIVTDEDVNPPSVDLNGLFDDADLATGGTLNFDIAVLSGAPILDGAPVVTGQSLQLTLAENQNGLVIIEVTGNDGETPVALLPSTTFQLEVTPVNDVPVVIGSLPPLNTLNEDDPDQTVSLLGLFDDVDIVTNGDSLRFEVSANTNEDLFSDVSITGSNLNLSLTPNAFGTASISIIALDGEDEATSPVTLAVDVSGINDNVIANDDTAVVNEDGATLVIDVLANDSAPDAPASLVSVSDPGTFVQLNEVGDPQTDPEPVVGVVEIVDDKLEFTPGTNFFGEVVLQYTMQDLDGEQDTAEVTITVIEVNDPPQALPLQEYVVQSGEQLNVSAENGLLRGAFDLDENLLGDGVNPSIDETLTVTRESNPGIGSVPQFTSDGAFSYVAPGGSTGVDTFEYAVFDGDDLSSTGTVQITIIPPPPPPTPPVPGEVQIEFNLSNTPLEQSALVPPNVLVSMDDSGSMDWHITVSGLDDQGRFVLNNSGVATSNQRSRTFSYLYNLGGINTFGLGSNLGRILPSQEAVDTLWPANLYDVWQARSAAFNRIYYNPAVTYLPWEGFTVGNQLFVNAVPTAIQLNPRSPGTVLDITQRVGYESREVPDWDTDGGTRTINVVDYYIPRYYTAAGTLVEILPGGTFLGGPERDDCAGTGTSNTCTYDEEIQNFANWFQYYRSRELVAKAAIGGVVADLQDIRVGYETINRNTAARTDIEDMNDDFAEGAKRTLLDRIYDVNSNGGTPLRRALEDAGEILGCNVSGRDCPALPGAEGTCQQNFMLLFSDGYWNGASASGARTNNNDEDGTGPFDGGKYADTYSNTLADVAMYYYENDLFPLVEDAVPLGTLDLAGAPDGAFAANNELLHQHVKTYTIAFGVTGTVDVDAAQDATPGDTIVWPDPGSGNQARVDDMLHAALNGRGRFLNAGNPQELQNSVEAAFLEFTQAVSSTSAAAFNSTSLRNDTLFYRGFYDLRNRTGELLATNIDPATGVLSTQAWRASEQLDPGVAGITPASRVVVTYNPDTATGIPFRANLLTANQQLVLTPNQLNFLRGDRLFEQPAGSLRMRLPVNGLLGDIINSSPIFVGTPPSISIRDSEPFPQSSLYSDYVSARASRTPTVYVGANDGMLHGFNATTGVEQFAYVPNAIIDASLEDNNMLNNFTSSFYLHDYYVDLTPQVTGVFMRPDQGLPKRWLTALVGGLGAGGKGIFALNVDDPDSKLANESLAADSVLWEFTVADDTYPVDVNGVPLGGAIDAITDDNGNPVRDLGFALSEPVVAMTNVVDTDGENKWAAIFGNGPNSTAGVSTLFTLFMDGGLDGWDDPGDFEKIPTGFGVPLPGEQLAGFPNGLGTPAGIDADQNGTIDYVYAGDRLGNLFRFDLNDANPNSWDVTLLFKATFDEGGIDRIQPILTQPFVIDHPQREGFLVIFGTGSFITEEDGVDQEIQTVYGIWDNLSVSPQTAQPDTKANRLVSQTFENVGSTEAITDIIRLFSENPVEYETDFEASGFGTYGWYFDLNAPAAGDASGPPQFPGEKAIRRFFFRNGAILTTTVLPATNNTSCLGARPGALMIFDALTGGAFTAPLLDFNNDGVIDEQDLVNGQVASLVFNFGDFDGALVDPSILGTDFADSDFLYLSGGNETRVLDIAPRTRRKLGRQSWVELQE